MRISLLPAPSPTVEEQVDVSILIPAHNEAARIGPFLEEVLAFMEDLRNKKGVSFEVIVAEDGSSDGTFQIAQRFVLASSAVRVLHHGHRLGKGGALKAAFSISRAEVVFFMDADAGYRPSEIPLFLRALRSSDIAIGVRSPDRMERLPPIRRRVAGLVFNLLFRIFFRSHVHDTQAGFKAFRRATLQTLLPRIRSNGFEMDAEIIARAERLDIDLVEVPISYSYVRGSTIRIVRDGLAMASSLLGVLIDILSQPRHRADHLPLLKLET